MILKQLCGSAKGALGRYLLRQPLEPVAASHRLFATSSSRANKNTSEIKFLNDKYSTFSFKQIKTLSKILSNDILKQYKTNDLKGERIAVLCNNNYTYLVSLLAIWMANGVPLGLNKQYPPNLIDYFVNDADCKLVINGLESSIVNEKSPEFEAVLDKHRVVNYKLVEDVFYKRKDENNNNNFSPREELAALNEMRMLMKEQSKKDAVILYTSGTTGKPKGVVLTFENVTSLAEILIESWQFSAQDCVLHVLPLNHVHGLLYGLLTSFYNGNQVDMLPKFDANTVWSKMLDENSPVNAFFGVPTVYVHLVNAYLNNPEFQAKYPKERIQQIIKNKMRLIVCGSAPLNAKTDKEWLDITGYKLLDRYGMTEIGLGLSNPYDIEKRITGTVGRPYGQTSVRVVDAKAPEGQDQNHVLIESSMTEDKFFKGTDNSKEPIIGELQIKGSMVFKKYHNKPAQTKESFTEDGWFKTGDTAEFLRDLKVYKLAGRTSVDIIKSGGYKISALDIEREVLAHPNVDDVAIIGLSDPTWGQRIFALIVPKKSSDGKSFDEKEFIQWCKQKLPKYQVPKQVKLIDKMPRNLLGKVNKKELVKIYEAEQPSK